MTSSSTISHSAHPVEEPEWEGGEEGEEEGDGAEEEDSWHCCRGTLPEYRPDCAKEGDEFDGEREEEGVALGSTFPT